MALTERPADWHFVMSLPEEHDLTSVLTEEWRIPFKEPVFCGGLEYTLARPLEIAAEVRRTPVGADLTLSLTGDVKTQCSKCLSPITVAINGDFMYSYILQSEDVGKEEEEEFYDSDRVKIPVTWLGSTLDVTDTIWECLIVSLPMYATCPDGCAEDVDSFLPKEDRVDPRFLALADLLDKHKEEGVN